MKFLLFSDQHLRSASDRPKWRVDNHYETQFRELEEVSSIAKINKVDMIIGGGDTIHHPDISHSLVTDMMNWCKSLPCPFYSIVGNHCCYGMRTQDLKSSALGVLFESGSIGRLDELVFEKEKVIIRGIHANVDPRVGNYQFEEKYNDFFKIVVSHNYISPKSLPFDFVYPKDLKTNADIVYCGHLHHGFDHMEGKTRFINGSSLSRWKIDEQHQPQVLIFDTMTRIVTPIELKFSRPANEIFDLAAAAEIKSNEMNLQTFVDSLENTQFDQADVEQIILQEGKKQQIAQEIVDMALSKVQQAKVDLK